MEEPLYLGFVVVFFHLPSYAQAQEYCMRHITEWICGWVQVWNGAGGMAPGFRMGAGRLQYFV